MIPLLAALMLPPLAAVAPAGAPAARPADLPVLWSRELLEEGPRGLAPSVLARSLAGRRVRLIGFMARMEEEAPGSFWLTARPVECDEGGAGTGDLPPGSVRVLLRDGAGEPPAHLSGPIAVTGLFQLGARDGGRVPAADFHLLLDPPAHAPARSAVHPQ